MKKLLLSTMILASVTGLEAPARKGYRRPAAVAPAPAPVAPAAPVPTAANPFAHIPALIANLDKNKGDAQKNQNDLRVAIDSIHTAFSKLTLQEAAKLDPKVKIDTSLALRDLSTRTQALLKNYLNNWYCFAYFNQNDPVVAELYTMQDKIDQCKEKMNGVGYLKSGYRWAKNHPKTSIAVAVYLAMRTGVAVYNRKENIDTANLGDWTKFFINNLTGLSLQYAKQKNS